jgi:hypothetical protein
MNNFDQNFFARNKNFDERSTQFNNIFVDCFVWDDELILKQNRHGKKKKEIKLNYYFCQSNFFKIKDSSLLHGLSSVLTFSIKANNFFKAEI